MCKKHAVCLPSAKVETTKYRTLLTAYLVSLLLCGGLWLGVGGTAIAAEDKEAMDFDAELADFSEWTGETPAMPEVIPEHWMTYHILHPDRSASDPGDPNAAIYYKGRYHFHYIYRNRFGVCFAHLSSKDMVNWKWHETSLAPPTTGGYGMFSGTAFLTKEGKPAIIYHGTGREQNVVQFALDDTLDSWSKAIPVIPMGPDGKEADSNNWDPDCWLNNDTYYAISGGRPPQLMKSDDLKNWEFMGKLFHEDTPWKDLGLDPNEDVSCANMYKIGDKWMLLCISHRLGCRYFLGDFKDEKFLPTEHHPMNWHEVDFFAPESLLTPDGRRVIWAWMLDGMWKDISGRQSLPRELSLVDGKVMQKPLKELQGLRYDEVDEGAVSVAAGERKKLERIAGPATEISAVFEPTDAEAFGLNIFCGDDGDHMRIGYLADEKKLVVGEVKAPFELEDDEAFELTVYLDKGMVDVFANGRQAVTTGMEDGYKRLGVEVFADGEDANASIKGWKMRSIYENVLAAAKGAVKEPPVAKQFRFVPSRRQVGDTMPFYWNGEYHVYYLMNPTGNYQINWEHIVSKDLVNWTELPPALSHEPDDPTGPDGVCIFTGDVVEKDGIFHAWYTSWNPRNPDGREFLSHATSFDLINWTKHPEHMIGPDGVHYANHRARDFRDPDIIWNEEKEEYTMYVFANFIDEMDSHEVEMREQEAGRFAILTSKDLVTWKQEPPIEGVPGGETPSHLKIGDTYYIVSNDFGYSHADDIEGPFKRAKLPNGIVVKELDGLQTAAKTIWDGKRHVWFGGWCGRSMPIPHEIYAGPNGLLYVKPVEETVASFNKTAVDLTEKPLDTVVDVPLAYMLECQIMLDTTSRFTVSVGETIHFSLVAHNDPNQGKLSLEGSSSDVTRPCPLETSKPTKIQAFVDETLIEIFVNDQFVQTCIPNIWWPMEATLKLTAEGGKVEVLKSEVRIRR